MLGLEIKPIDIGAYRAGNVGIDYVTTFDSGRAGPHVMVAALTHGNEVAGAHALDFLFRQGIRPSRGRLTLAFVNVAAYHRFDPLDPTASRYVDEDLNRLWSDEILEGPRSSAELARARQLRPLLATVDVLLDLHSMHHPSPPLTLSGLTAKGRDLALRVGFPTTVVRDAGHVAGPRMRDYGAFADPDRPATALLVECGQHWQRATVAVAIETMLRFLIAAGAVSQAAVAAHLSRRTPQPPQVIEVTHAITIDTDGFRFVGDFRGLEVIREAGTLLAYDGDTEVRTPHPDCVLIMPSKQLSPGLTAVRLGRVV
ncbi:MAG: succinylglutamate desuccinylase [Alphaproteobacteria bacterium]|nr:succinylglutamate desuccinylase [Alphaproteobacteria bacterium]